MSLKNKNGHQGRYYERGLLYMNFLWWIAVDSDFIAPAVEYKIISHLLGPGPYGQYTHTMPRLIFLNQSIKAH
jgi:hypothetical protein